jgi:DNA-binding beta-propeller fold protein YncE
MKTGGETDYSADTGTPSIRPAEGRMLRWQRTSMRTGRKRGWRSRENHVRARPRRQSRIDGVSTTFKSFQVISPGGDLYHEVCSNLNQLNEEGFMRTNAAHLPIKAWARLAVAVVGLPLFGQQSDLLVSSWRNGALLEYNGTTGAFVNALIPFGGVLEPGGVTFGPDGNIYLSDFSLVLRLNGSTGALMGAFVPSGYGGLKDATYLVFGPDGNLYVSDFDASNVKRYNGQSGSFMGVFTSGETVAVHNPQGLAFGPDGNLYVADEVNVLQYSGTTGSFIRVFVSGGSGGP